jgi:OHCU decarboxylase
VTNLPGNGDVVRDLRWFNALSDVDAINELLKCCGSEGWARQLVDKRPFLAVEELTRNAGEVWRSLAAEDWLEAFYGHPRIGENKAVREVPAESLDWSQQEQSAVDNSAPNTLEELAKLNEEYEARFGYTFIVCASGKSSEEILEMLRKRLTSGISNELEIAAAEQEKITKLRLNKLLGGRA